MIKQRVIRGLKMAGLQFLVPAVKLASGENPKLHARDLGQQIGLPLAALTIFLLMWASLSAQITTSLGQLPGPVDVKNAAASLFAEHHASRAKAEAFYARQVQRNEKKFDKAVAKLEATNTLSATTLAEKLNRYMQVDDLAATTALVQSYASNGSLTMSELKPAVLEKMKMRAFTGAATFFDQILTSLLTVFTGFFFATLIAIPVGVACGLSKTLNMAISPLIQIFKPISPLAWLPIVTMIVSGVYVSDDPMLEKSFINSAMTVTLCCLWPTLINTAVGVSSIDNDLINVGRVIRLSWFTQVRKIALPASLPMIFTGLRISLGIGWMVLIAAEMLAQNPGLGKFVWDEFQNGSSQSLARIMFAVVTIGFIGFILDWLMTTLQKLVSHAPEH